MNLNLQVRYSTEGDSWLCFRHAVEVATQGVEVETTIDDFGSEYYMGTTSCTRCAKEEERRR